MSNSQEQSLNEDAVFLPVTESSPEFLYSEMERQAVERLINAGPEAFYSSIGAELSGCFLSSEEVSQITNWAQDYRLNPSQVQPLENRLSSDINDACSTYFPLQSDVPVPDLELGWPESSPWVPEGSITVHTSPPTEGDPPVREVIRRHLQKASQVIAIVTDRLTDGVIIGDLHNAASRGVPVYIILNQRSIQESFTLNRLRHPNIQVRVLGGKTFCSRTGRMVVGEMKNNFILVDLEAVIHGSYSLTWTDAHLHRQLITVLRGPVVQSFDREFRILYAASLPVLDTWRVGGTHADVSHQLKEFSNQRFKKQLSWEPELISPPSPPTDSLLDWEAMGVIQRDSFIPEDPFDQQEEVFVKETPLQNNTLFAKNTPVVNGFTDKGNQFMDKKRVTKITSPVTKTVPDKPTTIRDPEYFQTNTQHSPADPRPPGRIKKVERELEKALSRQLSTEKKKIIDDKTRTEGKAKEQTPNIVPLTPTKRSDRSRKESVPEGESRITNETCTKVENTPSSRKPLILMVPQSESFSSLSDIMKRIQLKESSSGKLKRTSKAAVSEMSRSMMDLSTANTDTSNDERGVPVPRFKGGHFDQNPITPASSLMRIRSDDLKPLLYRTPKNFLPRERPRSSNYALKMDWRRSWAEMKTEEE